MSAPSVSEVLLDQLRLLLDPLVEAALDEQEVPPEDPANPPTTPEMYPAGLVEMLEDAGLADLIGQEVMDALPDLATQILAANVTLGSLAKGGQSEIVFLGQVIDTAFAVTDALKTLDTAIDDLRRQVAGMPLEDELPQQALQRLWHWLIWRRLEAAPKPLYTAAQLTGAVVPPDTGDPVKVDLRPIGGLFTDPQAVFTQAFGWGTPDIDAAFVLEQLLDLARDAGLDAEVRQRDIGGSDTPALHLSLVEHAFSPDAPPALTAAGGVWLAVGAVTAPEGFTIGFWGTAAPALSVALGNDTALTVTAKAAATDLPQVTLTPDGTAFDVPPTPGIDGNVTLSLRRAPDTPMTILPFGDLGGVTAGVLAGQVALSTTGALGLSVSLEQGLVQIRPDAPDSFLAELIPAEGLDVPFDLSGSWSDADGFKIDGSADLDIDLAVGQDLFGALRIETLHIQIPLIPIGGPEICLSATAGAKLGPVNATVTHIGVCISARLATEPGANGASFDGGTLDLRLGDLIVTARFKPPTGIGLTIDVGVAKGGGFLEIGENRYSGAFELGVQQIALQAFGVLTTKRPDGTDGFSLLAFVSGQFAPIQLGFGFTLLGVGGIVGLHRDVNPDALFAAVEAGTAGDLLAPENPVADAPRLIALAEGIFPERPGQYVFGPTVKLGWGTPQVLTLDLALAATLPEPFRLVLIGRLKGALPDEAVPVFKINLDLAGVLDVTGGTLNLRGKLFDSTVQLIPVQGGFALQAGWKDSRALLFSVGGFHPAFEAPDAFPDVIRMGAALTKGNRLRLALLGYFAITPNTLQIGAMAELKVSAAGFTLLGELGFDALIEFDPFRMQLDIAARVQVKRGKKSLFQLTFKGRLSGPNAWDVRGDALIELPLLPDVPIGVSETFGSVQAVPSDPVDVAARVRGAMSRPATWRASTDAAHLVLSGDTQDMCDPAGPVSATQTVAPFGLDWQCFYGKPVTGLGRLELPEVTAPDGTVLSRAGVTTGDFPPAAFRKMPEKDRLAAPAFASETAGVQLDPTDLRATGPIAPKDTGRVTRIIGPGSEPAFDGANLPGFDLDPVASQAPMIAVVDDQWVEAEEGGTNPGPGTTWSRARARTARPMLAGEIR